MTTVEDSLSPDRSGDRRQHAALSRRRLLRLSLQAATLPVAMWLGRPAGAGPALARTAHILGEGDPKAAYQAAFRAFVAEDRDVRAYLKPGKEFLYRPRQLLVAHGDLGRVVKRLRQLGYQFEITRGFGEMTRLVFDREADIPGVVGILRDPKQWPDESPPVVQPHHVTIGHDNIMGNPDGPPVSTGSIGAPPADRLGEGRGVTVGVCDTGIWSEAGVFHPRWLGGSYVPEADDVDPLYQSGDSLALQGGHGTFVAGVLRQAAPGVRFDPEQALNASGIGDEEMLYDALNRLAQQVSIINLSLGCTTQDDVAPVPMTRQLAEFEGRGVVVVASAGNAHWSRKTWPAAIPDVVAVAAVTRDNEGLALADYSNFGSWVDACAEGERTSMYVPGKLELSGQPTITFSGFARWSGTSFAAPYVAGRLAAMTGHGYTAVEARGDLLAASRWSPDYGVFVG
jgi:subtilisin family serine protease